MDNSSFKLAQCMLRTWWLLRIGKRKNNANVRQHRKIVSCVQLNVTQFIVFDDLKNIILWIIKMLNVLRGHHRSKRSDIIPIVTKNNKKILIIKLSITVANCIVSCCIVFSSVKAVHSSSVNSEKIVCCVFAHVGKTTRSTKDKIHHLARYDQCSAVAMSHRVRHNIDIPRGYGIARYTSFPTVPLFSQNNTSPIETSRWNGYAIVQVVLSLRTNPHSRIPIIPEKKLWSFNQYPCWHSVEFKEVCWIGAESRLLAKCIYHFWRGSN